MPLAIKTFAKNINCNMMTKSKDEEEKEGMKSTFFTCLVFINCKITFITYMHKYLCKILWAKIMEWLDGWCGDLFLRHTSPFFSISISPICLSLQLYCKLRYYFVVYLRLRYPCLVWFIASPEILSHLIITHNHLHCKTYSLICI